MKTTLIFLAVIIVAGAAFLSFKGPKVNFSHDTESGIKFHKGSFEEALARARKENKLVFLDIYAVWCGPCKKLKAKTFANKEVGDFFNSSFVNVALNGEEGEGSELAVKYGIQGYPSLLFINGSGEVVMTTSGYHNASELIDLGNNAKNNKQK